MTATNRVRAGGDVNITAREMNLTVQGSTITARNEVCLKSGEDTKLTEGAISGKTITAEMGRDLL